MTFAGQYLSEDDPMISSPGCNDHSNRNRYPIHKTLHGLFREQVNKTPKRPAVADFSSESPEKRWVLTYRELDNASNQLAHFLLQWGVSPRDMIAILLERSAEMLIGILAILKAGCTYVPLNPKAPAARNHLIMEQCNVKLGLTLGRLEKVAIEAGLTQWVNIDDKEQVQHMPGTTPDIMYRPEDVAYVIFTSGSTGIPKGVPITHTNLSPLLHWGYDHLGLEPDDTSLQNLSYYFDWSVWEIFITLTTGGCLYMVPETVLLNPEACVDFINQHKITVLHVTPTQYQYLLNVGRKLEWMKFLCIGAEKLTYDLVERSLESVPGSCRIFNMYGPTEATIISAVLEINRDDYLRFRELTSIPIGLAAGNMDLLVLDSNMNQVPVEAEGELYIGGDGLSLGYLGDEEKTTRSFVPNCFKARGVLGERLYKTGDRARILRDGNIEFLGRVDHQVKIRGFRIEPGEIENCLLSYKSVRDAVVIDIVKGNETYLCAYIVPAEEGRLGKITSRVLFDELKSELSKVLPDYMIPSYFIVLKNIPLNPNGKLDRHALPHPDDTPSASEYIAPRDEVERRLVQTWIDVLGDAQIPGGILGIDHDFFWIGGHSLKGMVLLSHIYKTFHVRISLEELFTAPTIRELAKMIRSQSPEEYQSIPVAPELDFYPASTRQRQLYILQQMVSSNVAYNIPLLFDLEELPDIERLEQVFQQLIRRHESFRTSFRMVNGQTIQYIHQPSEIAFTLRRDFVNDDRTTLDIPGLLHQYVKAFDLSHAPLIRGALIETSDKKGILFVDMHHIISDGISVEIFQRELLRLYQGEQLPGLGVRYRDYTCWLGDAYNQERMKQMETFWLKIFEGEPQVLDLPLDKPRQSVLSFEGTTLTFRLGLGETRALHDLCEVRKTSIYMVLLSIYSILLSRLSNQEEIVIGTPAAGRRHPDLEGVIGIFINTLALRLFPSGEKQFLDFLDEVKTLALDAFENQEYPFEELVSHLSPGNERDASRNPLYDVMFVLQNMESDPHIEYGGPNALKIKPYQYRSITAKMDMTFIGHETIEGLVIDVEYSTRLYTGETIERFFYYFKRIIAVLVEKPGQRIKEIDMLGKEEKEKLVVRFNQLDESFPVNKTIHELFEEQVSRSPKQIALLSENIKNGVLLSGLKKSWLTYEELNQGANQLARHLVKRGAGRHSCIGIMVERSVELMVGIIGILKTGAAYLPINSKNPGSRVKFLLEDSGARWLLTRVDLLENLEGREAIGNLAGILDLWTGTWYNGETANIASVPADSPAYIIYTSGSSGNPKGVLVTHANFCPLIHWGYRHIGLDQNDRVVQNLSYFFDWSVWEIFLALTSGASLYLCNEEILLNPQSMINYLNGFSITTLHITPTQLETIVHQKEARLESLKYLCIGAEKLTYDLAVRSFEVVNDDCRVFNMYGPTEATIISAVLEIGRPGVHAYQALASVAIGATVGNNYLLVLDPYMNLSPVGVKGELYIGGDGVALGYLNQPQLTVEKFIGCKFLQKNITEMISISLRSSSSLALFFYKTGDRVRWLTDGTIEFLGREDHQLKIRGYRIELGEIENVLLQYEAIKSAVVITMDVRGEKHLCAYFVPHSPITVEELKRYLYQELPAYMVPSYLIAIDDIPLNPNGKVDTRALPGIEDRVDHEIYLEPQNTVQEKLVKIWSDALGLDTDVIGIDHNFFQLGGHSLKGTIVITQIQKEFDIKISLSEIFNYPTIRRLSFFIEGASNEDYSEIEVVEEREYYDLSYAQRRLWILCQFEEDSSAYNVPGAYIISGAFNVRAYNRAVQELISRHESLRTAFILVNGEPKQKIISFIEYNVEVIDIQQLSKEEKEKKGRELFRFYANFVFHLEQPPLCLFKLIRFAPDTYLLVYNIHHIVDDGWSQGILDNEMVILYNNFSNDSPLVPPLQPLTLQYKDYAYWHNTLVDEDHFHNAEAYWVEKFKDKPNGIELPLDHPRKPIQTFNGSRVHFIIDQEKTSFLHRRCNEENATLFMGLLSLCSILLCKYAGQKEIIVGSPIAGRRRTELNPIVGFLVNTLVYRIEVNPAENFRQLLGMVKKETLDCYEYQDYPFDLLIDRLSLNRDLSQSPLFNVMLAHNNSDTIDYRLKMEGVAISEYPYSDDFNMSKFDIIYFMDERDDQIDVLLEYNSDLINRDTAERMARNLLVLLEHVLVEPERSIAFLDYLHPSEYETVVNDFNATSTPFPAGSLQELFQQKVNTHPDKVAVVNGCEHITYKVLNGWVNRLARYLTSQYQVIPGVIIGISLDRSIDMIIAIMAILKTGAGYVAIDPNYPEERIFHMLKDSNAQLLLRDNTRAELFENYEGTTINLLSHRDTISQMESTNPPVIDQPAHVLYVIYTSGTTGTPNGAMLSRGLLTNLVLWQQQKTSIDPSLRCLQFTSVNFCVSFQEIMITLTGGGEVHLIGDIERQDIDYLMDFLSRHRIEILYLPFSYLNFLFNESGRWQESGENFKHHLKHIITAGEQLKITSGLKCFLEMNPCLQLHNHYGSSEMHVVTSYTLDATRAGEQSVPPAGKPIANTRIYILDEYCKPSALGVWGELYVEGSYEVLGYINNDQLTQEKLFHHPALSVYGKHLYRSGDLGRWMNDGNIQLKGRKDTQYKIRGFRVELGEIESKILLIQEVRDCVVVVKDEPTGLKYLVAYVVGNKLDSNKIRRTISQFLPQYMIPKIMILETLPLMPNGKVDRTRLPEPEATFERNYEAPRNKTDQVLTGIWSNLLGIEKDSISISANFFEIGGHSLKATVMVSEIHKGLDARVPLTEIFKSPTIKEIADYIRGMVKERFQLIEPVEEKEYYPLSPSQEQVFIEQQMDIRSTHYNMPEVMILEGNLDIDLLESAFMQLVKRHESFRTAFILMGDVPVQRIIPGSDISFILERYETKGHDEMIQQCVEPGPFDLSSAPLLRGILITLDKEKYILAVDMHHIISDGVSYGIYTHEINALYSGNTLIPPRLRYRDYIVWQKKRKEQNLDSLAHCESYWLNKFRDGVPKLQLPYDYLQPRGKAFEGSIFHCLINRERKEALDHMAREEDVTLFMILLGLYYILLAKWTKQDDIVVGVPVAGRPHADLKEIIGMFVNTLLTRHQPASEKTFREFLRELKQITLEDFEHQDFLYETLVKRLNDRESKHDQPTRGSFFNVLFTFHGLAEQSRDDLKIDIPGVMVSPYNYKHSVSKFDLSLYTSEQPEGIDCLIEYSTRVFKPETIELLFERFCALLDHATTHMDTKIKDLDWQVEIESSFNRYANTDVVFDF